MEQFQYFAHDWILDRVRAPRIETIQVELITAGDRLGVRLVTFDGETPEGYYYMQFLIGAPSDDAFNEFKAVSAKWGFNEWTSVSEEDKTTIWLRSPYYEVTEPLRDPGTNTLYQAAVDGYWTKALHNEYLRAKQGGSVTGPYS